MTPHAHTQRAILVSADPKLIEMLPGLWLDDEISWTIFDSGKAAIQAIFNEPPDLLVVDEQLPDIPGTELCTLVKSENVYRQLPVILCVQPGVLLRGLDFDVVEADDLLVAPYDSAVCKARIDLRLIRASKALDANPLSKLPGNTSIIQKIQTLIDRQEDFALAYLDLDYFKSFNDKYGFSRGDEILMMTARLIVNTVRGIGGPSSFVGHVGGDDFVFIVTPDVAEDACKQVIASFDAIVPSFYDKEDRERGGIRSTDRQGQIREFPLMAISIAVVLNEDGRLKHFGEASAIAMGLKKKAKEDLKSSYVFDRRKEGYADSLQKS